MDVFKKLAELDIKSKIEKKGNQDYISWATAWGLVKTHYPKAVRTVYEDTLTGLNYFNDGKTGYVKVGITIEGLEHIDYLPIMNFKNQSIPIESITSMDVNKTIQRSTAKAIAMHGLGLQLWSGEEMIEAVKAPEQKPKEKVELKTNDSNWDKVKAYVEANKSLDLATIVKNLEVKYKISTAVKRELSKLMN
jgi:hypothetical protein